MSKLSSPKSPDKTQGVKWWQQAVRSFITPYGAAKDAPEPTTIFNRLQPFTCEWLSRPDVALSEFADTILLNIPILEKNGTKIVHSAFLSSLKEEFTPVWENLQALNKKSNATGASRANAKKVLEVMIDNDNLDRVMEKMFQLAHAMFGISTNYIIASTLLRHPSSLQKLF